MSLKIEVARALLELREQFTKDIVEAEKNGGGHYGDEDFASLEQFMIWLSNHYGN